MLTVLLLAAATSGHQCRQVHYKADGSVVESWVPDKGEASSTSASSTSKHGGSAHSSVSARSSSSGSSSASSSSTNSDGHRRSVRVTRDETGCRIVIDERPGPGDEE